MEINDAFRRIVLGHWRLLCVALVLGSALAGYLVMSAVPQYQASSRIEAASTTFGSTTEADSAANRVTGIATDPAIVGQALADAHVAGRDAAKVAADEVSVNRMGSSGVFDIVVTDRDRTVPRALADALTSRVLGFLGRDGDTTQRMLADLGAQQSALRAQRQQTALNLSLSKNAAEQANLQATLAGQDQQLNELAAAISQLQVTAAGHDTAVLVSAAGPAVRAGRHVWMTGAIAGILGVVVGLLAACALETIRPRMGSTREVARDLGAPLIDATSGDALAATLATRARRLGVASLALSTDRPASDTDALARALTALLAAGPPSQTDLPSSNGHLKGHGPALAGTGRAVQTLTPRRTVGAPPAPTVAVTVVSADQALASPADAALVVLVHPPVPVARFRQFEALRDVTGWPVAAVVDGRRVTLRPEGSAGA